MKAIILKVSPYKEKSAMITALTENGLISFCARGVFSSKSKHLFLNNEMSIVDLEMVDKNPSDTHLLLKKAAPVFVPVGNLDYERLSLVMFVLEIFNTILTDEDTSSLFDLLFKTLEAIKKGEDYYRLVLLVLAKSIILSGYCFEVNRCVFCDKKNDIVGFSFIEGGFICQECLKNIQCNTLYTKNLRIIRYLFVCKDFNKPDGLEIERTIFLDLLKQFSIFIKDNLGVTLKSINLIME